MNRSCYFDCKIVMGENRIENCCQKVLILIKTRTALFIILKLKVTASCNENSYVDTNCSFTCEHVVFTSKYNE